LILFTVLVHLLIIILILIIDFSNGDQLDNRNNFVKELNSTNAFDADFFSTEESIRQGLVDQIDLDHLEQLHMLTEPNIDVTNNDHFRM